MVGIKVHCSPCGWYSATCLSIQPVSTSSASMSYNNATLPPPGIDVSALSGPPEAI